MIELELENGKHQYFYDVSETAKMLALRDANGKLIGRNKMFRVLRHPENKVLMPNNYLYQNYLNFGWGLMHTTTKRWKSYTLPMFSDSGIAYLKQGFASGKYKVILEPKMQKNTVDINTVC